ncbi:hypothetical protein AB4584_11760 [Vibrio splendidus]
MNNNTPKKKYLFPTFKQFNNWSLPSKLTAYGLILAVIGLLYSIFTSMEFNKDPRESLSSKGIEWNYQNFLSAITSDDIEAIELFSEAGMKLKSNHFQSLVNDYLSPEISTVFLEYEVVSASICPVNYESLAFYAHLENDISKMSFIKKICSNELVISKFNRLLEKEKKSLKKREINNLNRKSQINSCMSKLSKTKTHDFYSEASKFVITSVNTYSIRQEVLAKLNVEILLNSSKLNKPDEFLSLQIEEVCKRNNPIMSNTKDRIIKVEKAIKLLAV